MKRNIVVAAIMSLFVLAIGISGQDKKPGKGSDFSGTWTLDGSKSKLGDRNRIESQTMTVTQSGTEITIKTESKMAAPPAGAPAGGGGGGTGGGRGMGGGGGAGGPQATTYALNKESKMDQPGPGGATIPVTLVSKIDGSNLWLTRSS